MTRRALALTLLLASLAGCAVGGGDDPEAVIRGWSGAVNAGDYERAGTFFAPNAVVEQIGETRLRDPADGARFSSSLPCRADVVEVVRGERTSLATFRLRDGRGACSGSAEVRFAVHDGKLTEWRQLPPPPPVEGQPA